MHFADFIRAGAGRRSQNNQLNLEYQINKRQKTSKLENRDKERRWDRPEIFKYAPKATYKKILGNTIAPKRINLRRRQGEMNQ